MLLPLSLYLRRRYATVTAGDAIVGPAGVTGALGGPNEIAGDFCAADSFAVSVPAFAAVASGIPAPGEGGRELVLLFSTLKCRGNCRAVVTGDDPRGGSGRMVPGDGERTLPTPRPDTTAVGDGARVPPGASSASSCMMESLSPLLRDRGFGPGSRRGARD